MSDQMNAAILQSLKVAARHRRNAETRAQEFRKATDDLILEGVERGIPKQQLADAAGLTRQTVYTLLFKAGVAT